MKILAYCETFLKISLLVVRNGQKWPFFATGRSPGDAVKAKKSIFKKLIHRSGVGNFWPPPLKKSPLFSRGAVKITNFGQKWPFKPPTPDTPHVSMRKSGRNGQNFRFCLNQAICLRRGRYLQEGFILLVF